MLKEKRYKETFEKISQEKREKIIQIAVSEFASNGFRGANINVIAKKAGISIGSMYNYFATKEDLFLTCMDEGYKLLEDAIGSVSLDNKDLFGKLEELVRAAQRFARQYPEIHQLYLDATTEGLSDLSRQVSRKIENISAVFYREEIDNAKKQGLVREDIDTRVACFCIDNIILLTQFSYTSEYFKERLKIFIGDDALEDDERLVQGVMQFYRGALST